MISIATHSSETKRRPRTKHSDNIPDPNNIHIRRTLRGQTRRSTEMVVWSMLCGVSPSRRYKEDLNEATMPFPEASLPLKSDACQSPAEAVTSGSLVPDNTFVDIPTNILQDHQAELPWHSIRDLVQAVWQRRRRLRLGFSRKDRHSVQRTNSLSPEEGNKVKVPPHLSNEIQQIGKPGSSRSPAQDEVDGRPEVEVTSTMLAPTSTPVSMAALPRQNNSVLKTDSGHGKVGPGVVLLAEGKPSPESMSVLGSMTTSADQSSAVSTVEAGGRARNELESDLVLESHPSVVNEPVGNSSETETTKFSGQHPNAPSRQDSDDWCTSAGMIKDAAGENRAEKLFYDTGSPDSWASQKLIDKHKIPTRPILPENLKEYRTMGNELVIPHDYAEIELKDDHNGIHQFQKVSFNIIESMGGRGLLLGRAFMYDNGVALDPKQGPGVYVFTAREASDAAKEQQRRLLEERERHRLLAKALATSSTTGSTTPATSTSRAEKPAPSSRTSTSSAASKFPPPPKYS